MVCYLNIISKNTVFCLLLAVLVDEYRPEFHIFNSGKFKRWKIWVMFTSAGHP